VVKTLQLQVVATELSVIGDENGPTVQQSQNEKAACRKLSASVRNCCKRLRCWVTFLPVVVASHLHSCFFPAYFVNSMRLLCLLVLNAHWFSKGTQDMAIFSLFSDA
jgi:hypothetical protein